MCDSYTHPTNKKLHQVNLLRVCVCDLPPNHSAISHHAGQAKAADQYWALTGSAHVFRHLGVILPTLTYFVTRHAFVQPVYFLKRL